MSPGLFSIYVNDFLESISQGELHLYADDTAAFVIADGTNAPTSCSMWKHCTWIQVSRIQHRGKTSTHALGWTFPVSFSVTLSSQIKVSRALSASILCAACGSVVLLHAAGVFNYFVVIEIAFLDNQAQITETIIRLDSEKVRW